MCGRNAKEATVWNREQRCVILKCMALGWIQTEEFNIAQTEQWHNHIFFALLFFLFFFFFFIFIKLASLNFQSERWLSVFQQFIRVMSKKCVLSVRAVVWARPDGGLRSYSIGMAQWIISYCVWIMCQLHKYMLEKLILETQTIAILTLLFVLH